MERRQFRRSNEKRIFGVCGGIAEYLNRSPTIIRAAWFVITLLTAVVPGTILYLLFAVVMKNPE